MKRVPAPAALRWNQWRLAIEGHTRALGEPARIAEGRGARWIFQAECVPMRTADALEVRAWLHSLRGRSGSLLLQLPGATYGAPSGPYLVYITYSDGTVYTDGTTYDDATFSATSPEDGITTLAVSAAVDATSLTLATPSPAGQLVPGALMYVGTPFGEGQLVRVTTVSGLTVGVRPALRAAYASGTRVVYGRVWSRWRLVDTPAVPLINSRSLPFTLDLEEDY